jgi:hypothetical protein
MEASCSFGMVDSAGSLDVRIFQHADTPSLGWKRSELFALWIAVILCSDGQEKGEFSMGVQITLNASLLPGRDLCLLPVHHAMECSSETARTRRSVKPVEAGIHSKR